MTMFPDETVDNSTKREIRRVETSERRITPNKERIWIGHARKNGRASWVARTNDWDRYVKEPKQSPSREIDI